LKISELKEIYSKDKNLSELGIEIQKYQSIAAKKVMVDEILDRCLEHDKNGMIVCDFVARKLNIDLVYILNYTNIEFNENEVVSDYDWLQENGIVELIKDNINEEELWFIESVVGEEIEQKTALNNSVEAVLNRNLVKAVEKIPTAKELDKLLKKFMKEFQSFDFSKLQVLGDIYKELQSKPKS